VCDETTPILDAGNRLLPDTLGIPIVLSKRAFCKYYFYSSQKGLTHQDVMAFVDLEADAVNGASMQRHIEHFRACG
jgi:hypothetical protein